MPLDPNIILSGKPVEFADPLQSAGRALQFKALANQSQLQGLQMQEAQQKYNDEQAMRNAYANNSKVDSSGNTSFDQQGFYKSLGQTAPHLLPQAQAQFAQLSNAQLKAGIERMQGIGQMLNGVTDDASYQAAKAHALQSGADPRQFPEHYDPNVVSALQAQGQSVTEHMKQLAENRGLDLKADEIAQKREEFRFNKNEGAFKDLMGHAESSRQLPDVKQAYTDRYSTQKILDLIGNKDPNKLNPNMVNLLVSEVAKVAQGGAPTEESMKNLTPTTAKALMASWKQYYSNHPEAGQQGAFVKVFKNYANTLQENANKVIYENMGNLGDSYKDHLRPEDYAKFKKTFIEGNPYAQTLAEGASGKKSGGVMSFDDWKAQQSEQASK